MIDLWLAAVLCCLTAIKKLFFEPMRIKNLTICFAVLLLVAAKMSLAQSDSAIVLRYEALHYLTIASVMQHHVINERLTAKELSVSIHAYRLDRKGEEGAFRDSVSLGTSRRSLAGLSGDSLAKFRASLMVTPAAKAVESYRLEYLGRIDTIAGLPSYEYAVVTGNVREFLVWIANAPPGLENLIIWQTIEYSQRSISFLLEEEVCNMIRLVLLRGFDFPPSMPGSKSPFIITRYDTAVNDDFFTVRDNTYLYELKSVTVTKSTLK